MFRSLSLLFAGFCVSIVSPATASAPIPNPPPGFVDEAFASWLTDFRQEALAAGISGTVFDRAMRGVRPDPKVVDANNNQPEFVRPVWDYLASAISDTRVSNGQEKLRALSLIHI